MTEGALHIERWHIPIGDVLSLHLDNADMARLVEARVVGNTLIIDMEGEPHARVERPVAPPRPVPEPLPERGLVHRHDAEEASSLDDLGTGQSAGAPALLGNAEHEDAPEAPAEPELKGGALARAAAMTCQEGAFKFYMQEKMGEREGDAEVAAKQRRGVTSRRMLDHDPVAAQRWRDLKREYDLWMVVE